MFSDCKKDLVYLHGLDVTRALCHYAGQGTRFKFCHGNKRAAKAGKAAAATAAAQPGPVDPIVHTTVSGQTLRSTVLVDSHQVPQVSEATKAVVAVPSHVDASGADGMRAVSP